MLQKRKGALKIMNNTNQEIQKVIITVDDRNELIRALDAVYENGLQDQSRVREKLNNDFSRRIIEIVLRTAQFIDPSQFLEQVSQLKKNLSLCRVFRITLAFNASESTIDRISSFVKEQFGEDVILEVLKDESIVGGSIVEFEGVYRDYSLNKMIDKVFEKNRNEILSLMK